MNRLKRLVFFMPLYFYQYGNQKGITPENLSFADVEYLSNSLQIWDAIQ